MIRNPIPIQPILRLFPFFDAASQPFQKEILAHGTGVLLPAGANYFEEGQQCGHIALLGSGDIRVFKRGESGREITLYHVEQGETCVLTAACVLGHSAYPASAAVEQETRAVVFPAPVFRDWVTRREAVSHFVFSTMAKRMEGILSLVGEITFRKMDERLHQFLQEKITQGSPNPVIQMTHEEIAAELGTAREVVSRLLKDFERRGYLIQHRGLIRMQTSPGEK